MIYYGESAWQASTQQGLVRELEARGECAGASVLRPVPRVSGGLTEPPVVPRFLASLQVRGACRAAYSIKEHPARPEPLCWLVD